MSEAPQREWRFYLKDMLEFADKVLSYTNGMNQQAFVAHELSYDATIRNLELIGESATHIPESIRADHPELPGASSLRPATG